MTQHSAASHRARGWKQEADALRQALEFEGATCANWQVEFRREVKAHAEARQLLAEARQDLALSRAAHEISRAEAADGRQLRAELVALLRRHGIEV